MSVFSGLLYKKLRLFLLLVISSFTVAMGIYYSFWAKDQEVLGILFFTFGLMGFLISIIGFYINFRESISARKELQLKAKSNISLEYTVGPSGMLTGLPILHEWKVDAADWLWFWISQYKLQLGFFILAFVVTGTGLLVGIVVENSLLISISLGFIGVLCMLCLVWMITRIYPFPFKSVQITITTRSVGYNRNYFEFVNQRLWLSHVLLEKGSGVSQITLQSYWNSRNSKESSALKLPVPLGKLSEAVKLCEELKELYFSRATEQ
ncbi:MAG: hypothetical protein K2P88_11070 [Chitinophagaceae bacterium]|jgi:hypothetical protein|nr:hypothetical protein [Chitinophagaceae bacterium]